MTDGLGLGEAYGATIERIKAQGGDKSRLGMAALMWISHAERPLTADELCHALAVELGSRDFMVSNLPSMSTLVGCCQGLITVDKEASTVRLVHFTLQEYLSAHPDVFTRPHSAIAEVCLTYLNSKQVRSILAYQYYKIDVTFFLQYCSLYWGVHAKRDLSDCARSLVLELFQEFDGHISTKLLLGQQRKFRYKQEVFGPGFRFSGLHCASFFGISRIVDALIAMQCYDINEGDFRGHTPLAWAARNGHNEVVKILLGQEEINPDKPENHGYTPLLIAAENGHEDVVKTLLGREDVHPNKPSSYGYTPLSCAACQGHEGVVKILLDQEGVSPDTPTNDGQTPLSYAAGCGHEGVVKTLLQREEVNPDRPDSYGTTPLSAAAQSGNEGVVKILLGRDEVNPETLDRDGDTPLSCAAYGGNEGVVKILLEQEGVNPDIPNHAGQTPLSYAARRGHEGVVKVLLEQEGVDPTRADNSGQTPINFATMYGHQRVAELLQLHEAAAQALSQA